MLRVGGEQVPVVDCDVHEALSTIDDLMPYLEPTWRRYVTECGFRSLPGDPYVATAHGGRRADSWPEDGGAPGSDYDLMAQHVFEEHSIDYVVLTGHFYRLTTMPQVDFAKGLMSAYNDWFIDEWLSKDDRFRGSIQVTLLDPKAAAREIDRVGGHPQMVQVLLPCVADRALGHPDYRPVYEAAVRNDLAVAIHVSSFGGAAATARMMGSNPRTYLEYHQNFALAYQAQLTNLVLEGVFEQFPQLRVVLLEGGYAWVPHLLWSLDAHWRSLQLEVPWLTRRPSDAIREHVWFGTQPIILPDRVEEFVELLEMFDGKDRLIFATDYPHWDFDAPSRFLPASVPVEWRQQILGANALALYDLPAVTPDRVRDPA